MRCQEIFKVTTVLMILLFRPANLLAQRLAQKFPTDSVDNKSLAVSSICSNDILLDRLRKDPTFKAKEEKMNQEILNASRNLAGDTITLPVVVHIINPNPNAVTDLQILNGIQDLNDAFGKTGIYAASRGVDTKIRFCLAQKDPDGGNTTGITRTTSFFSLHLNRDIEDRRLKNLMRWDPLRYINIWLITSIDAESYADFICGYWYRLGTGGYATLPPGGGPLDGIVITSFGKLLTHEMGHYLGLYHTFEGGCYNFDCTIYGDRVCDTPPDGSVRPSFGCNFPDNSCNTDTLSNYSNGIFRTDVPDQIDNFMDYGNNACANRFTQGQADRMRATIMTQRSGLLENLCARPCNENIIASFRRDLSYPLPGDTIRFVNTSAGAANYEWSVNGTSVSNSANFSYSFNTTGKNKVTLKAYNNAACFASSTDYIIVNCGVTARFYTDKQTIASKLNIYTDSILFTNSSYNGQSFQWLMSNDNGMAEQVISTNSTSWTYVFPEPATYRIRLIATNGGCSDTTETYTVPVFDPTADAVPFAARLYCFQNNKVRVDFCIADYGFAPIPVNTPVNFYDADPRLPGAKKLSPSYYLPYAVPGGNCGMCYTHTLDIAYHGLEKIFIAVNDSGKTVPIVFPNTALIEKNYFNNITNSQPNRTTVITAICEGQNYAGYTRTGIYVDTLTSIINGCDSIRTLQLTVKPVYKTTVTTSICEGQNYAGHTQSGTYIDVYSAVNGCDSTRTLHLTVKPVFKTSVTASICEGQNYYGHKTSGTYTDRFFAANGCDSIRTVSLTVKPIVRTTVDATICRGQNYSGHTVSGTYTDTFFGVNGCDSIRTLRLTVNPTYSTTVTASICQGENYAGHTASGTYTDVYSAANGCDSTRTLFLTVHPLKFTTVHASICEGDNYAGHSTSGIYTDVYTTVNGCDSTRTLHLTVKPLIRTSVAAAICEGYDYAGHTESGVYADVYTAVNGCDSIRTLQLTVNPQKLTVINAAICRGESYFAAGAWQTETGVYYDTAQTYLGCDSVISTVLTVHPLPVPNLGSDRGVCIDKELILNPGNFESYLWQDGSTNPSFITNTIGNYFVSVTNTFGCRAADTMRLTEIYPLPVNFLPPDSSLCKGNILRIEVPGYINYNWSAGISESFNDITKTGTYSLQVTDRNGCSGTDSMHVLFYENCIVIQVPNAFTPNKDGRNDVFKPLIPALVSNYRMQIWNRWGQLLFETATPGKGWDGTLQSQEQAAGVYVYHISFTDHDGRKVARSGTVVLIR